MAITRGSTGHAAPRQAYVPASAPSISSTTRTKTKTKTTAKKSAAPKAQANSSKPRAKKTTAGRVEKKKVPVSKKVKGAIEKAKGIIEKKPGKKGAGTKEMKGTAGRGAGRSVKS